DAHEANNGTSWTDAYTDLHSALAAAQSGDQIWVAAGRYVGNFTLALGVELYGGFAGTESELTQRDWTANPTILDGDATGSVVTSPSWATTTTRIDGFTITNGSASHYGGGLYLYYSSPSIANNTITGNSAPSGGGLYLYHSSATIANNTIAANGTYYNGGGGGLYLENSTPTIANNTIIVNSAGSGSGLFLRTSSPTIADNTITGNSAEFDGGGLCLFHSSATIANNTITGNCAEIGGGLCLDSSSPTVANNTITGNSAGYGGGLWLYNSSPTIGNTIVAFNSSGVYRAANTGTPTLRYNCVYGNAIYNYSGLPDYTGMDGNISTDPMFVRLPDPGPEGTWGGVDDDYGDVRLRGGSPAINAGDPGLVPQPGETDLDAHARVLCGRVDMGAYEFGIGDYDCDQSVDLSDISSWPECMSGPSAAEWRMTNGEERMGPNEGTDDRIGDLRFEIADACAAFDFDADGDVDLRDLASFQRVFAGQ
ncbi:MAG: right-handed parallel beta-helix repeat-containing protein, partial [Phycisphaerales bacterium]|nr:right-handed parallel beta-helix repeat-containing protein [Phycisphaerales bacterium]